MLTFDAGIFDPERRPQVLIDLFASFGVTIDEETVAPTVEILNLVAPTKPETTSEYIEVLGLLVTALVAQGVAQGVEAFMTETNARLDALES